MQYALVQINKCTWAFNAYMVTSNQKILGILRPQTTDSDQISNMLTIPNMNSFTGLSLVT